jgi:hypothetical protein
VRDVYADPFAIELLRGVNGRAASAERVQHRDGNDLLTISLKKGL